MPRKSANKKSLSRDATRVARKIKEKRPQNKELYRHWHKLRQCPSRAVKLFTAIEDNNAETSEPASTSASENNSAMEVDRPLGSLDQETGLSQENVSQNETLSFPLELLSGTAFAYSQQTCNPVHENIDSGNVPHLTNAAYAPKLDSDPFSQTIPEIVDMSAAATRSDIETLVTTTPESGIEITDTPDFLVDSQQPTIHSDIIIDAHSLSEDQLNSTVYYIVNTEDSDSNLKIPGGKPDINTSDVVIEFNDSQQTWIFNHNFEHMNIGNKDNKVQNSETNKKPEDVGNFEPPSPAFHLDRADNSSRAVLRSNAPYNEVHEADARAKLQENTQRDVSTNSDADVIAETQYSMTQDVLEQVAVNENHHLDSPYDNHCIQSNSFLNYRYSESSIFSAVTTNEITKDPNSKPITHKFVLSGLSVKWNQTNSGDVSETELFCEKLNKAQDDIMKARNACLAKCLEAPVSSKLTRKFVEKFCVNIFEEPAESVINIDYKPTFRNLHFARSSVAKIYEIMNSSMSMTQVFDETLTKVVTEHSDDTEKLDSSDSENEESNANKTWLKAYINESKHVRKDLNQKLRIGSKNDETGKNLREMCILQEDNSKDEELQELLMKFGDCKWLED